MNSDGCLGGIPMDIGTALREHVFSELGNVSPRPRKGTKAGVNANIPPTAIRTLIGQRTAR